MFTDYDKKYCFHFISTWTKLQSWVKHFDAKFTPPWLTLSWRRPLYRNQSIDLLSKPMDWLLYDNGLRHERVKTKIFFISALRSLRHGNKAMATGKRNLILIEPLFWERSIKKKICLFIYCYVHYTMIKAKYYFSFYHLVHHVCIILHLPATLTTSVILWISLQTIPLLTNICVTYQEFQWSFKI